MNAEQMPGVMPAIVDSLDDPKAMGRVQLTFQGMDQAPKSAWARIASPMAGKDRGFQLMPEIGDEVLVAFEHGDFRRPYVIGGLWNGQDKPPVVEPAKRHLRTVSGHVLELDDTAGSERISLLFKGDVPGITIEQDAIEIKFSDTCFIRLSAAELRIQNSTLVAINP